MHNPRCGFVTLLGAPNAGKSTLTNRLIGCKVSIVTHKAQTTRRRVLGITQHHATQLIFIDTPGIFAPKRPLDRAMVNTAMSSLSDADIGLLLVDATRKERASIKQILGGLPPSSPPLVLVLNKVDKLSKEVLLPLSAELNALYPFDRTFMISALNGSGIGALLDYLSQKLPEGPWHYPDDQASDLTDRQLAAEIVREKLFLQLHEELPYHLTVDTESWEERKDGSVKLSMIIYIDRPSHKPIVLGEGGQKIKTVGKLAREELTRIFERPVHLFLFVKLKEKWTEQPELYASLGLDFGDT